MSSRRAPGWIALVLLALSSGCMTVLSTADIGPCVYGGVRSGVGMIAEDRSLWFFAALFDLPLSAVADTLFLPVSIPVTVRRASRAARRKDSNALFVTLLQPGEPLQVAGVDSGDDVVGIDGERFEGRKHLEEVLERSRAKTTIALMLRRGGDERVVQVQAIDFYEALAAGTFFYARKDD